MKKALVPVLIVLLVLVSGLAVYLGVTRDKDSDDSEDAKTSEAAKCAVQAYTMGVRWQQQSAEARALQGQTYDLATERLDEVVKNASDDEDLAIMTDLDETAVDNTDLLARDIAKCHDYAPFDDWSDWEQKGQPRLIPGALEFFKHADELGVDIYYVSDRTVENQKDNEASIKKLGLPQVESDHVLLLGPSKAERRAKIQKDHELVMQLGDSLADFDGDFKDAPLDKQKKLVKKNQSKFGKEWFILPNATYGSWSDAKLSEWDSPLVTEDDED